jgi:Tfp pilus assembly protein PilN
MRAVNLLPEKHRPRQSSGGKSGSAYVLLGVLGAVVVAVLMYVLTLNSINSAKTDIAEAKAAAAQANAQADSLGAYGNFAKVKEQRVDTVKALASQRMDWERMVRELAHVLPAGVWIQTASATASGTADTSTSSSTTSSTDSSGEPTLTVVGCAPNEAVVAQTLVRLRELQGAKDVKLAHSASQDEDATAGGASTSGSTADCGKSHGKANYDFQADVTFDQTAPAADENDHVPASLGGGQ